MVPVFSNPPIHEPSISDCCALFLFFKDTWGTVSASTFVSLAVLPTQWVLSYLLVCDARLGKHIPLSFLSAPKAEHCSEG